MTERDYYDKFDHTERECHCEYGDKIYCHCSGLEMTDQVKEFGCCTICYNESDNLYHECKWCGGRISHEKYKEL